MGLIRALYRDPNTGYISETADGDVLYGSGGNPNVFSTLQVSAAGNTSIWIPASGKSFRLLKYMIEGTLNMAQTYQGVLTVSFQDGTTQLPFAHDIYVSSPALRYNVNYQSGWIDLGGTGYLSGTPDNVLNVNLTATLTAGNFRILVCGTEE